MAVVNSNMKLFEVQWRSLLEELLKIFNLSKEELQVLWNRIGFPREHQLKRIYRIEQLIKELFDDILDSERTAEKDLLKSIEENMSLLVNISKELSESCPMPHESMSIIEQESHFRKHFDVLRKEKYERMTKLKELKLLESQLCAKVGSPKLNIFSDTCPSLSDLKDLEHQIIFLKTEIKIRTNSMNVISNSIKTYIETLGRCPNNDLEIMVFSNGFLDNVSFSNESIEKFRIVNDSLELEINKVRKEIDTLLMNIEDLLNKLNLPKDFISKNEFDTNLYEIRKGLAEKHFELICLKKENIKRFIDSIKDELYGLWNDALFSLDEKKKFFELYEDTYNEDILVIYESELQNVKEYIEENKDLILLIRKREELFNLMITFEINQSDTSRFNNRGGALLKEEKQRNAIKAQLPKLENELKVILEEKKLKGVTFKYKGESYLDIMRNQWKDFNYQRDEKKRKRAIQKIGDVLNSSIVSSTSLLRTPCSTMKSISTPKSTRTEITFSNKKTHTAMILGKSQWRSPTVTKAQKKSIGKFKVENLKNKRPSLKNTLILLDHRNSFGLKLKYKKKSKSYRESINV